MAGRGLVSKLAPALGLIVAAVIFYAIPPHAPVTMLDVRTIAVHTVIVGTAALGMTLVIISGGIDLSIGSGVALASIAAAGVMFGARQLAGTPEAIGWWWPAVALLAALAAGGLCGVINGALITGLRLPPFIVTLGTLGLYRGVAKWASGSRQITAPSGWMEGWVRPIPRHDWVLVAPAVWMMGALAVIVAWGLRATVFGRLATAIGSNEEAARRCGVPVERVKVLVYAAGGLFVGLAGALQFARLSQGDPTVAAGLELDVIAAVVIGGASLSGGTGSVAGTIAGAVLMAFLRNRCIVLGLPNFVQEMIVGPIIILAVAVDRWRRR